jgi:hypothetical protein
MTPLKRAIDENNSDVVALLRSVGAAEDEDEDEDEEEEEEEEEDEA